MSSPKTLHEAVLLAARRYPSRTALEVGGQALDYASLTQRALSVAAALQAQDDGAPVVALLCERSVAGLSALLGILCAGKAYLPLQPSWPSARLAALIARSGSTAVVVDAAGAEALPTAASLRVFRADARRPAADWIPPERGADDLAYLMFTSGSTGSPKGVAVTHGNILHFLRVMRQRYRLRCTDRFSSAFALTFDLSLFDLFAAWSVGGCVCCPDPIQALLPSGFIREARLSVWFSVPSVIRRMKAAGHLEPGALDGLRLSLFCGEALTRPLAAAWARATPRSRLENLYGPTELTLACTAHTVEADDLGPQAPDVVSVGTPLPESRAVIVGPRSEAVAPGTAGELLVAGPQVTRGYWRAPALTAQRYVSLPGQAHIA